MAGRGTINLNYYNEAHINRFKEATDRQHNGGAFDWASYVDANGYPIADMPSNILMVARVFELRDNYTGNWVLKWTGKLGGMAISQGSVFWTVVSGGSFATGSEYNLILSGTNGRVVFNTTTKLDGWAFYFQSGAKGWDGTLANMVLCRESEESRLDSGQPFQQRFLDYIAYINPKTLRHLNTLPVNQAIQARWGNRTQTTEFTYGSVRVVPSVHAGVLTGDQDYTCALPSGSPATWTDGETVTAYVGSANTGSGPTLDVGERGAKTIVTTGLSTVNASGLGVGIKAFYYSALHDKLIYQATLFTKSWAVEDCIALANATNTNLWLLINAEADDDSVTSMVTLVRNTLNSGLKLYIELSNETWNTLFIAYSMFSNIGLALGLNANANRARFSAMGKRVRETMGLATAAWSPRSSSELVRVMPTWIEANVTDNNNLLFNGDDLAAYGFNSSPNRPIDFCDVVAIAPYNTGAQVKGYSASYATPVTDAVAAADDYDSGDPERMNAALDWLYADYDHGIKNDVLWLRSLKSFRDSIYPNWNEIMVTYGKTMIGYEGAMEMYQPDNATCTALGISTAYTAKFAALITAFKRSTKAKRLMASYLYQWDAQSNFAEPAVYTNLGDDPWSLRVNIADTPLGLEDGFRLYNNGVRPFLLTTS